MGDRILEVGGAGLEGMDAKVKALMNNMVNSDTPGYRKSDVVIKSFPSYLDEATRKSSTHIPQIEGVSINQTPGTLIRTGNVTDVAIGGDGFFVLATPWGEGYTRDGRFTIDQNGRLVSVAGNYPVLGTGGEIVINPNSKIDISVDGKIRADGVDVNTLRIVTVEDKTKLKPASGSLFKADAEASMQIVAAPRVMSGYMEAANVNIIEEMMNLIYLSRAYGVDAKIISNREAMLTRAMEIGKPAQ